MADKADTRYVVTAPLAIVNLAGGAGGPVYVDRDSLVPTNADPDHVKHLLDTGLIKPAE